MCFTRSTVLSAALLFLGTAYLTGCEKKPAETPTPAAQGAHDHGTKDAHHHDQAHGGDHDHDHDHDHAPGDDGHSHGPTTQLGEQTVDGFTIKASRDGAVTAGGDAPIDVWVTGGGEVSAVRFWIGTQDAKGSVKARAELERDHWHTHAEVPSPLPPGSKLWVEIEAAQGKKTIAGFDLK